MNPMKFGGFLLVNLLVCIWLGYLIDSWTNMSPVWIIVFTLYAIIGSFLVLLYRNTKKDKKKSSGKEETPCPRIFGSFSATAGRPP